MKKKLLLTDFKPIQLGTLHDQNLLNQYHKSLFYKVTKKPVGTLVTQEAEGEAKSHYDYVSNQIDRYSIGKDMINKRQLLMHEQIKNFISNEMEVSTLEEYQFPEMFKNISHENKGAKLDDRMEWFKNEMQHVFDIFYNNKQEAPENLIHVTCSGYSSPSVAQIAMSQRNWLNSTVTHSYQMGCYGAFPAIRTANALLTASEDNGRIDIIHTELLSAHINLTEFSSSNSLISSLFADGFIGYSLYEENKFRKIKPNASALKILAFHEVMIESSLEDMSWDLGAHNFLMTLSRKVPVFIRNNIKQFLSDLCSKVGVDLEKEKYNLLFAIHPGGPKIIDYIIKEMELFEDQAKWSINVLRRQGNMSSATIPYVFNDMLNDDSIKKGTKIVSMAFGPGLTATSMLVEKV